MIKINDQEMIDHFQVFGLRQFGGEDIWFDSFSDAVTDQERHGGVLLVRDCYMGEAREVNLEEMTVSAG